MDYGYSPWLWSCGHAIFMQTLGSDSRVWGNIMDIFPTLVHRWTQGLSF